MLFFESNVFDLWCEKVYGKALKQSGMVTYNELKTMFENITLKEDSLILDIGCGLGGLTNETAVHYRSRAVGIDIDRNMIENAKKHYKDNPDLTFRVTDGSKIASENNKYDLICMFDTIYFNTDPNTLANFLDDCTGILNKDGKIAVFTSLIPDNSLNIKPMNYHEELLKWSENRNVDINSVCLSEDFRNFWPNAFKACLELKDTFAKEIPEAYEKMARKCSVFSDMSNKQPDGLCRWLDIVCISR